MLMVDCGRGMVSSVVNMAADEASRTQASRDAVKQGRENDASGERTLTHPMQAKAFSTMGNQMA